MPPTPARPASPGACTSAFFSSRKRLIAGVPGQPDTGEDLPADGVIPVAEAGPHDVRPDRPGPSPQHAVVAVEERLRVLLIDHRGETGPRPQRRGGPLPHVAEHLLR